MPAEFFLSINHKKALCLLTLYLVRTSDSQMKDSGFEPTRDMTTRPCFPTICSIYKQQEEDKNYSLNQKNLVVITSGLLKEVHELRISTDLLNDSSDLSHFCQLFKSCLQNIFHVTVLFICIQSKSLEKKCMTVSYSFINYYSQYLTETVSVLLLHAVSRDLLAL